MPPISYVDGLTDRNRHCPRFSPAYLSLLFVDLLQWAFPPLTSGPSHLGLILILMSQHEEASVELGVHLLVVYSPVLPYRLRVGGSTPVPLGDLY